MSELTETTVTESTPPKPAPKVRTTYLSEAAILEGGAIDEANYTVPVVLIKPGWSANSRYYSRDMLTRAIPAFEGAKAFADHPSSAEQKDRPERSVKDITGYYTNVRQRESDGALVATRHVVGAAREWLWPLIKETTANKPDLFGLSINAMGKTAQGEAEGKKGILVEDILPSRSTSIDDVTTPAAGGKYESLRASDDALTTDLLAAMDYDEWAQVRPDFIQRLRESMKTLRQEEALREATAQTQTLQEVVAQKDKRITELEEAQRATAQQLSDLRADIAQREARGYADRLIAESRLPSAWQPNVRANLLSESNTGNWPAMLSAEQAKFAAVRPPIAVRGAGMMGASVKEASVPWALPGEDAEQFRRRTQPLRS